MHVPAAWLVQAFECPYDLDNIHLESTPNGVHAIFKLENILVEGRCYEDGSYQPTPGLQLQLHPVGGGAAPMDTLVMANLGYFQLKANPGVWQLGIRPGRSLDVYDFKSVDDVGVTLNVKPNVVLNSFTGTNIQVTMERRPGMETAKLLDSGVNTGGEETGMMGGNDEQGGGTTVGAGSGRTGETINVFSLASGHLYERFLKIMMLSVLKNTNNPVKFWFLKNCMSPQLQEFLPHFAVEYGFSYELVQYKWPSWLNLPPTKHRQIWGYKILFLDTLFPLNVNKIIFVDADQVVRADLNELLEIDLEGAPYAYTPFCDDRKEMDGFRFWNSGYWKGHLDGRPYHISALYVVDLIRFRQLGAGDRLREQYQGLSRDPNSLSNLDQDLPNNMVHQVPIKSLPQEWLWCETWCSDGIKGAAKTIDLCNNPLTKEPKLDAAVRIVSEWSDLDSEARNVTTWVETKLAARQAGSGSHEVKDEL
jgi:UDP-glucose:glycoprotein glucosyltransferase